MKVQCSVWESQLKGLIESPLRALDGGGTGVDTSPPGIYYQRVVSYATWAGMPPLKITGGSTIGYNEDAAPANGSRYTKATWRVEWRETNPNTLAVEDASAQWVTTVTYARTGNTKTVFTTTGPTYDAGLSGFPNTTKYGNNYDTSEPYSNGALNFSDKFVPSAWVNGGSYHVSVNTPTHIRIEPDSYTGGALEFKFIDVLLETEIPHSDAMNLANAGLNEAELLNPTRVYNGTAGFAGGTADFHFCYYYQTPYPYDMNRTNEMAVQLFADYATGEDASSGVPVGDHWEYAYYATNQYDDLITRGAYFAAAKGQFWTYGSTDIYDEPGGGVITITGAPRYVASCKTAIRVVDARIGDRITVSFNTSTLERYRSASILDGRGTGQYTFTPADCGQQQDLHLTFNYAPYSEALPSLASASKKIDNNQKIDSA